MGRVFIDGVCSYVCYEWLRHNRCLMRQYSNAEFIYTDVKSLFLCPVSSGLPPSVQQPPSPWRTAGITPVDSAASACRASALQHRIDSLDCSRALTPSARNVWADWSSRTTSSKELFFVRLWVSACCDLKQTCQFLSIWCIISSMHSHRHVFAKSLH